MARLDWLLAPGSWFPGRWITGGQFLIGRWAFDKWLRLQFALQIQFVYLAARCRDPGVALTAVKIAAAALWAKSIGGLPVATGFSASFSLLFLAVLSVICAVRRGLEAPAQHLGERCFAHILCLQWTTPALFGRRARSGPAGHTLMTGPERILRRAERSKVLLCASVCVCECASVERKVSTRALAFFYGIFLLPPLVPEDSAGLTQLPGRAYGNRWAHWQRSVV